MKNDFFKYRDRFFELAEQNGIGGAYKDFKAIVLGKFGSGKSTFINALLGKVAMPMRILPTTAIITEIKYGEDTNSISVFYSDGSVKSYDYDEFVKEMTFTAADQAEIETYGGLYNSRFGKINHAETCNSSVFLKNRVTIIDTPAIGVDEYSMRYEYLSAADAVIFVLSAPMLFSNMECEYIAENFAGNEIRNVFFVVNSIDNLPEWALESDIIPCVRAKLKKVFTDDQGIFNEELFSKRIFYVSAYRALFAKTGKKGTMFDGGRETSFDIDINETGLPEFESALEQCHIESELRKMAKLYHDNTNGFGFRHRNEIREAHNIEAYAQMRLLLDLAYETVYGEQPTESDLRQLVI